MDVKLVRALRCILLVAWAVAIADGLLIEDDCPAPPPCVCDRHTIDCDSKHLVQFPSFRNNSAKIPDLWSVYLSQNNISYIPDNAFLNIANVTNHPYIELHLEDNNLNDSSFGIDAFNGIAEKVQTLILDDNKLTSIPAAFGKLTHISQLSIKDNPIATIDPAVMRPMRHSIDMLDISLPNVKTWPEAFHSFDVRYLEVYNYKYSYPNDAFSEMAGRLWKLSIFTSTFSILPEAFCSLHILSYLVINGNDNFTGKLPSCPVPLTAVTTIELAFVKLKTFPNVFELFPKVYGLSIYATHIADIDDSAVPLNTQLLYLRIRRSKLTRFPQAINRFTSLKTCDLSRNFITSLHPHALENLLNLTDLILNENPLVYISNFAFQNLPALRTLKLQSTNLTTIPRAIETLPGLSLLELTNAPRLNTKDTPIECSCNMRWMTQWMTNRNTSIAIKGHCEASREDLQLFIKQTLPKCP